MFVKYFFFFALFILAFFESTIFSFPIFFTGAVLLFILYPTKDLHIIIFLGAFFLDALKAQPAGITSLFIFLTFLLLTFINRFLNLKDPKTLALFILAFCLLYSSIFSYPSSFISYSVFFFVLFFGMTYFKKRVL